MSLVDRFKKLYAGVVYDALQFDAKYDKPFVVSSKIKNKVRSTEGEVHFGHAFTCKGQNVSHEHHINDDVRLKMFDAFTNGCIQVIDTGENHTVAHFGDISGKLARKYGAIGAVINGFTRDLRIIDQDAFPVYCYGTMPVDAFGIWQVVDYQVPIILPGITGSVTIRPDDYLFCDDDGVMMIPRELVNQVCSHAEKRLENEKTVRREIENSNDLIALRERIGRW